MISNLLQPHAAVFLALATLALTGGVAAQKPANSTNATAPKATVDPLIQPLPCKSDLTKSFGLDGIATSIPNDLDMCPGVVNSCCTTSDLITISEAWNAESGRTAIKERFAYYQKQNQKVIKVIKDLVGVASSLSVKYQNETNCKMLARTISNFKIAKIEDKLASIQVTMARYFENYFKGFYCNICDANNHFLIDTTGMTVSMSQGQCRSLVSATLPVLMYLHIHFPKILKLMVTFVSSCDGVGNFVPAAIDVKNLVIETSSSTSETLTGCRANYNTEDWVNSCSGICKKASLVNLDKFFYPHLEKYQKIAAYLTSSMTVLQQASAAAASGSGAAATGGKRSRRLRHEDRLLQNSANKTSNGTAKTNATAGAGAAKNGTSGNGTANATNASATVTVTKPPKSTDPAKLYSDPKIIEAGLNKLINAENFVSNIVEVGLDQFMWGRLAQINKQAVDVAKQKLKIENMPGAKPFSSVQILGALGYKPDGSPMVPNAPSGNSTSAPSTPEFASAPDAPTCSLNYFDDTKKPTSLVAMMAAKDKIMEVAYKDWIFKSSGGKMGSPPPPGVAKPVLGPDGKVLPAGGAAGSLQAASGATKPKNAAVLSALVTLLLATFVY